MPGILYIVATPIGNLDDMPPRVAATFGAADFVAAEDTRVTLKLLNHLGLKKPMMSYYEHALHHGAAILDRIEAGESCALCSDAGMPCISDPGEQIVKDAIARGITVTPVPGASACVTALAVSGQDTARFVFEGFLLAVSPELAGIALVAYAVLGVLLPLISAKACGTTGRQSREGAGKLGAFVLDSLRGASETIQFAGGADRSRALGKLTEQVGAVDARLKRRQAASEAVADALILAANLVMLGRALQE